MGPRDKLIFPVRCAAVLVCVTLPSGAAERQLEVELDYRADPSCPTRERFLSEVAERELTLAPGDTGSAPTVTIELTEVRGKARGRLTVKSERSGTTERSVDAPSCDEATRALALITALALMPEATEITAAESEPTREEPEPAPEAEPTTERPPRRRRVVYQTVRALFEGAFDTAPEPAFAASGGVGVGMDSGSFWSPFARLGARGTFATSSALAETTASARFQQTVALIELCPFGILRGRVTAHLCVPTELGVLSASGNGTDEDASISRFYGASGVGLELSLGLVSSLSLDLAGSLLVPYERSDFELAGTTVFTTPSVTTRLGAGLGWTFGRR